MTETATLRKVLIVDDDRDIREIVKGVIQMLHFDAVEAADGVKGLEVFEQELPDVVVLDVMMPGRDGNDLRRALKATSHGALVPVLMLTARDSLEDKVTSLKDGADDYLTKPFHYRELQARIEALMRIRVLTLELHRKNQELQAMQSRLVQMERQSAVSQLAGTAAHQLGQPLSAIMLNCHLLETFESVDERHVRARDAIKRDVRRMADILEELRSADADATENYYQKSTIITLKK